MLVMGPLGDHAGGRSVVVQVTGEGNREVVGLEKLCREGKAGEKVRIVFDLIESSTPREDTPLDL